jgi:hypothetical protein
MCGHDSRFHFHTFTSQVKVGLASASKAPNGVQVRYVANDKLWLDKSQCILKATPFAGFSSANGVSSGAATTRPVFFYVKPGVASTILGNDPKDCQATALACETKYKVQVGLMLR